MPIWSFVHVYVTSYLLLLVGWILFLGRVVPVLTIDWFSVGLCAACVLGLACGMHFMLRWLTGEIAKKKSAQSQAPIEEEAPRATWKIQSTLALLGIFVLMFVAGTAAVGGVHQLVWLRTRSK